MLGPGEKTGGLHASDHPQSDQVVYVVSGNGEATVRDQTAPLAPGDVLIIEAGDPHELRCTGDEPLRTLNVYAPAAYCQQARHWCCQRDNLEHCSNQQVIGRLYR